MNRRIQVEIVILVALVAIFLVAFLAKKIFFDDSTSLKIVYLAFLAMSFSWLGAVEICTKKVLLRPWVKMQDHMFLFVLEVSVSFILAIFTIMHIMELVNKS